MIGILVQLLMSVVLGFGVNYVVTSEIIVRVFGGSQQAYMIVSILALIIQIFVIFIIMRLIVSKRINKPTLIAISVAYVSMLIVLLFGRVVMEPTFNFNLGYLFDFSGMNVMQNLLNFMFFIPLGWFACTLNQRDAVSLPIVIACVVASVIGIELIQYFSLRGIFDIVDIVLNVAGIMSGYYFTRYTIQTLQLKKV
ncbi:MAG: VanZ family protein [Culicoidibacterales bacterium]